VSVGCSNDEVNASVHRQLDTLQRVSTLFATEPQAAIAKKIASLTPGEQLTESLFTNGGTEANETAILPARCFTGNTGIVPVRHFSHGRTATAMTPTEARGGRPAAGQHRAHA
jgi:4-aminobutyrate aminotransferase-like enzyme